jgi:hypothetical protein
MTRMRDPPFDVSALTTGQPDVVRIIHPQGRAGRRDFEADAVDGEGGLAVYC